jgi:hypothetical protein
MKNNRYTVTAHCKSVDTRYSLLHDGEDWTEKPPYEEATFATREEAEAFAAEESEKFEVRHEMEIIEHEAE